MGGVVEATSDIYSTGVVMYEMLTGRVPFVGDTPVSVAMQHINDAPPPITDYAPETPPAVVAVVMKALAKNPKDRFQSAREMADALLQAKDGKLDPETLQTGFSRLPAGAVTPGRQQPVQPPKRPAENKPYRPGPVSQATGRMKKHRYSRRGILLTAAATVAVLAVLTFGILAIFNRVTNRVIAPDVEGYTAEEAMAMAKRAGLGWQQTEQNSDLIPAGVVISQLPEPDTEMSRGDSLLATVSLGPSQDTIPDCVGQLYDNISKNLRKQGFSIVVIRSVSTEPLGTILQQNPKGGEAFTPGQELELSISGGSTLVPDVTARTEEEAAKLLRENQLSVGETVYVEVLDESQIGMVMAQNPVSGTLAVLDAPVVLTVATQSKGYKGEISFTMEKADQDRTIRVTLMENGQEVEQYSAVYPAGQSGSVITPLSSAYGGSASCRVYVDGKLYLEQPVTME